MPVIEVEGEREPRQVGVPTAPAELDDDEILREMGVVVAEVVDMDQQVLAHAATRDEDWLRRLRSARGRRVTRHAALRAEALRRDLDPLPDYDANREAARNKLIARRERRRSKKLQLQIKREDNPSEGRMNHLRQREEAVAAEAERLKGVRVAMGASASKAKLFMRAAREILPSDQYEAIWASARLRWPDHAAWEGKGASGAVGGGEAGGAA